MADYFAFHARNSLEDYVTLALRAKEAGLPVKVGLEVDFYKDQMDVVSDVLAQYPFDVLIGSVHWLGTWGFDDVGNEVVMSEWARRDIDDAWRDYTEALSELAASHAVDVLAHPDLIKVAGFIPDNPTEYWDMMAEAASTVDISVELSSAGWRKPVAEQYPASGLLDRFVERGLTFTTASDAHRGDRVAERHGELASLLRERNVHELAGYEQRRRVVRPLGDASWPA
jgi:histidinol-phosphatase (PHP family)